MKKYEKLVSAIIFGTLLVGCSGVGGTPADNPPQMISYTSKANDKEAKGVWDKGKFIPKTGWDRPAAFGAVPNNLQATGDAICKQAQYQRAIGYHPKARNLEGQPIVGGGYLCGN